MESIASTSKPSIQIPIQEAWLDGLRFHHDLTAFPLLGLHAVVSCEQCHATLAFAPLAGDCKSCHAQDDVHEGAMGEDCAACHNPAGWSLWRFDHASSTGFSLDGGHRDLACADCHPANRPALNQSKACVACHRADDVHKGRFGQNCDRCHLSTSFEELKDDI